MTISMNPVGITIERTFTVYKIFQAVGHHKSTGNTGTYIHSIL